MFPYVDYYLGSFSFVPFGVLLGGTVVFCGLWLPETRGKSMREVMVGLEGRWRSRGGRETILVVETDSLPLAETAFL